MSALEGKAVIRTDGYLALFRALRKQQRDLRFSPKRTFRLWKFADIEGQPSARSSHSEFIGIIDSLSYELFVDAEHYVPKTRTG